MNLLNGNKKHYPIKQAKEKAEEETRKLVVRTAAAEERAIAAEQVLLFID